MLDIHSLKHSYLNGICYKGGGGGSGAVSHSAYLEGIHADWLCKGYLPGDPVDNIETSITECMNNALGSSPWTGINAYDPTTDIAAFEAEFAAYKLILTGLVDEDNFNNAYNASDIVVDNAVIAAEVAAYADIIDDDLNTKVLPRFRRGMQDINAVVASSAYPIGLSVMEGFRARDLAKFTADLRLKGQDHRMSATTLILQLFDKRITWRADYARNFTDAMRIKLIAFKEQLDQDMDIDSKDALWDLEVFQYGANLMAGVGGGTATPKTPSTSKVASALGGAMGGAAAGYMIGAGIGAMGASAATATATGVGTSVVTGTATGSAAGPIGAVIGAVVGAAVALLSS